MKNCYTFAFQIPYDPDTKRCFEEAHSPGDFASPPSPQSGSKRSYHNHYFFPSFAEWDIINAVKSDGGVLGFTIEKVSDGSGEVTEDSWIVGLAFYWGGFLSHLYDYHWYRKKSDGSWWQQTKKGGDIKCTDSSNKNIIDPQNCDRSQYNVFVGYYRVTLVEDSLIKRLWEENNE